VVEPKSPAAHPNNPRITSSSRARAKPQPTKALDLDEQRQEQQNANALDERSAARYLAVSHGTLRLWRSQGTGPRWYKAGEKLIRYRRSDLDAWIESRIEKVGRGQS
jgi:predicted DNA-binding transcriptional regulator AlpA